MSRIISTVILAGIMASAGSVASAQSCPGFADGLTIIEGRFEMPGPRPDSAPMGQTGAGVLTVFQPGRADIEHPQLVLTTSEPVPIGCQLPVSITVAGPSSTSTRARQALSSRFSTGGPTAEGEGTDRVVVDLNLAQSSTSEALIDAGIALSSGETPKSLRFKVIPPEIASFTIDPGTHVVGQPVGLTVTLPYMITEPMPVSFSTSPSQAGVFTMERVSNPSGLVVRPGLNPTATRFIFTPDAGQGPGDIVLKVSGPDRRILTQTLSLTSGLTGADGSDSGTIASSGTGLTAVSTSGSARKPGTPPAVCTLDAEILPMKIGLQRVIEVRLSNSGKTSCVPMPLKFVAYPTADPKALARLKPTPVKGPEKTPAIKAASVGLKGGPGIWTGQFNWPAVKSSDGISFEMILGDGKSPGLAEMISFTPAQLEKMK